MSPKWKLGETPVMPKSRYKIMADYMPKVGTRGLDMMFRTCTVQVNLDFSSEADMRDKMRVGLALQPIATALFANSPFTDNKPNGFLSYRAEIWRDTDRNRTGMLPFAFLDGFGFERYVDWALDVPMYFVMRGGRYHDDDELHLPPVHGRARAERPARPAPDHGRLEEPSLDALPRGAAEDLPRDARRRRRAVAAARARCRRSGSGSSTTRPRSTPRGS